MRSIKNYLILCSLFLVAQLDANQPLDDKKIKRNSFKEGEKLTFLLRYGFIHGGKASFSLTNANHNGHEVLHAKIYAKTTGLTDKVFHIEDIYESYFDQNNVLPYKAIRNINEGGYKFYNEVAFVHNDTLVHSHKSGQHTVPKGTLDMVSAFYYLRSLDFEDFKKGDEINLNTFFDDALFPFKLRYRGKEKVKTKMGKIRCHRFDPIVEPGRIFKSEDDMSFWLTDDENHVPVLIKFDLIVGSVKCELIHHENLSSAINWEK